MAFFSSNNIMGLCATKLDQGYDLETISIDVKNEKVEIIQYGKLNLNVKSSVKSKFILTYSSSNVICIQSDSESPEKALNEVLPGANLESFFVQKLNDIFCFLNSEELEECIEFLGSKSIEISSIFLEPVVLIALAENLGKSLKGNYYSSSKTGEIQSAKASEISTITIDDHDLSSEAALAFGGCFSKIQNLSEAWNLPASVKSKQKEEIEKTKLRTVLGVGVSVLLIAALTNLYFHSSYSSKIAELDTVLYSTNSSEERLESLKSQVQIQAALSEGVNKITKSQGAFLLDQICTLIPESIELDYLGIATPKKIKTNSQINFSSNEIGISGYSTNTASLNHWIDEISNLDKVQEVDLMSYENNDEVNGKFSLKVILRNA